MDARSLVNAVCQVRDMRQRRTSPAMSPALKVLLATGVLGAVCLIAFGGLSFFGFFGTAKQTQKSREQEWSLYPVL